MSLYRRVLFERFHCSDNKMIKTVRVKDSDESIVSSMLIHAVFKNYIIILL